MATIPNDALTIQAMLREMGIDEYEPRIVSQLLEFSYRYTSEILESARSLSEFGSKKQIDEADVELAIDLAAAAKRNTAPHRQTLLDAAALKNSEPLPAIKQNFGLRLPNDRFCVVQPNLEWKDNKSIREIGEKMGRAEKIAEQMIDLSMTTKPEAITNLLKRPASNDDDFDGL